ncbi:MAG: translation initiation factor 2 [Lachnospiraceae bacterium]|nr:translation initiation factor 2 [Lachnospiraceae bacterium]
MKGRIRIVVSTKRLRYELNLRRNITIIQGDSASGKTSLIQIISDYASGRTGPGTEVVCERKCVVLSGDTENVLTQLSLLKNAVVFVDEQEKFLHSKSFAKAVLISDCYFVLVTRDGLNMLPYSINEIYYLKNSGYYQNTKQVYNSMHQVYPEMNKPEKIALSTVLTEDSNSGHDMFKAICHDLNLTCDSADGKSNVAKYILSHKDKPIFAIVDGAAFGADMQSTMHAIEVNQKSHVWTPESFEYLILQSGIIHAEKLQELLNNPEEFIESSEYSSWERFFTRLLEDLTQNSIYAYNKKKLNPNYLTKGNIEKMKKILLDIGLLLPNVQI